MKIKLVLLVLFSFWLSMCFAQQSQITGTVREKVNNEPLPGALVIVLSSKISVVTDINGQYSISALPSDTLEFSYISYKKQLSPVQGRSTVDAYLVTLDETLDEVVITALGISREEKSLGYSVSKMDVKTATTIRDPNVVNSMQGKLAGVDIKKTSGGPGASSRILIRGNSSITNNNQPLVVVDGIPIDNTTTGTGGTWGGIDYGSPISDINPDDIESLVLLKGPSAAALYGSRALNGVIVITTKKGSGDKSWSFSLNSTSSVETPYILKDFQNKYGAGERGKFKYGADSIPFFETDRSSSPTFASSWGPEMLGQTYRDWDSSLTTFSPQEDNYAKFFQNGYTFTNSISASRGGAFPLRISFTDLRNRGISPTSTFRRNNLNISSGGELSKKLRYALKLTYADQNAFNRVNQSNGHNAARNIIMMPRNVTAESLMDFQDENGNERVWYDDWQWIGNPFFTLNRNINFDDRQRYLGNFSLVHKTNDWLTLMGRLGLDSFDEDRHNRFVKGSFIVPNGQFSEERINFFEINADFLATVEKNLREDLNFTAYIGGNRMGQSRDVRSIFGTDLALSDVYNIENSMGENSADISREFNKRINSVYSSVQLEYKKKLFLEVTGRNDWSSTLPDDNNSYFYPSTSLSYLISEELGKNSKFLTFAKLRASIAEVGKDGDPYLLELAYDSLNSISGVGLQNVANPFPLVNLEPEKKRSYELGLDIRFFENRLGFDFTYYRENTFNQILIPSVSATSGFTSAVVNGGEIQNSGIELLINSTIIEKKNFKWRNMINFSQNENLVVSLNDNANKRNLGNQWRIDVNAVPGLPYGSIFGYGIQKDENGNRLLKADGTYVRTESQVLLGDINPDWKMGISNGFEYKNWSASFFIDIQKGGDLYSATNMYLHGYAGNVTATLEGREEWYASEAEREDQGVNADTFDGENYIINWQPTGGYEVSGIYAEGTIINGEDVSGQEVSRYIDPQNYWSQFAAWENEIHEPFVYDASYVKLREVSISYRFGSEAFGKKIQNVTMSISGRNLWLIHSNIPNIDPESTYSNGNGQGVEYAAYPNARSIGFNLKANF